MRMWRGTRRLRSGRDARLDALPTAPVEFRIGCKACEERATDAWWPP
jgi:hypothetical protein